MTIKSLGSEVAGTVAAQTGVAMDATPFLPNRVVEGYILPSADMAGTDAVIVIQSSPDNSTWTTVLTMTGLGPKVGDVTLDAYMRANVTTAAGTTAGEYSAFLRSGN